MKKFWHASLLFIIFLPVALLRFYQLGRIPAGIHADEASYGYDAFSLLQTGKDVWGQTYPLVFKSFGEYKLNLPYLIAPAVSAFGLSTTATRLPSAIFGLATVVVLYFTLSLYIRSRRISLLLSLIFAFSPWSFGISRLFFESNVALFFLAFGLLGNLRAAKTKRYGRLYYFGVASLALAGYFYAPARFLGLGIFALGLIRSKLQVRRSILVYLLVALPVLPQYFSGTGLNRLKQESAARSFEHSLIINENRALCARKFCYLLWNKPLMRAESVFLVIAQSLSPGYLFFDSADNYIVPVSTGPYLLYLLPFYIIGMFYLVKKKDRYFFLILFGTVAVAASGGKLSLYRNTFGLYLCFIPIALGLYQAVTWRRILAPLVVVVALFFHTRYLVHYFYINSTSSTFAWSADAEFIARYIKEHEEDYRTIIDKSAGDFGPLYYSFYTRYDPDLFRTRAEWTSGDPAGWTHVGKLGHIASHDLRSIENLICEKASAPKDDLGTLYISAPLPDYSRFADLVTRDLRGEKVMHEIYDLDSLFTKLMADNPANLYRLCPQETLNW